MQSSAEKLVKSPLNYTGGKFRLLSQLLPLFPECETFVDLFGGGFNVGANVKAGNVIYNDRQKEVTRLVELLWKTPIDKLVRNIDTIIKDIGLSDTFRHGYSFYECDSNDGLSTVNREAYSALRNAYNESRQSSKKDFFLLVLIFYSFNNQIRFNDLKQFNLPAGKRDFNGSMRQHLRAFCESIQSKNISFYSLDFEKLEPLINENCFVYCDPPYLLGNAAYNEQGGWTENDEKRLLSFLERLDRKGISFGLSNVLKHHGKENTILKKWCDANNFAVHHLKISYRNSNYHIKDKISLSDEVYVTNFKGLTNALF